MKPEVEKKPLADNPEQKGIGREENPLSPWIEKRRPPAPTVFDGRNRPVLSPATQAPAAPPTKNLSPSLAMAAGLKQKTTAAVRWFWETYRKITKIKNLQKSHGQV